MSTHCIINSWPHHWYGFWRSAGHDYAELPTLDVATDPTWSPGDKELLLAYLTATPNVISCMSVTTCLLCEADEAALCYRSDGVWLWPDSLAHYARVHRVVLPAAFVQHIRSREYRPPIETDIALRDLPWPEAWAVMRRLFG